MTRVNNRIEEGTLDMQNIRGNRAKRGKKEDISSLIE